VSGQHGEVRVAGEESFESLVLNSDRPVLVDFWAAWCAPCKQVAPVVAQLAAEFADQLAVVAVDVDANPNLTERYGIMSIPQLLLFESGQEVKRIVGARPRSLILRELAGYVG